MMSEDDLIKRINETMKAEDFDKKELDIDTKVLSEKLDGMESTVKEVGDFLSQYFIHEMMAKPFEIKTMLAGQSAMLLKTIAESYFKMVRKIIEEKDGLEDGK